MMTSITTSPAPETYIVRRIPDASRHYSLGTIPIRSGRVLITDPCCEKNVGELLEYPDGSLCNRMLECVPGNYKVRYTMDADSEMASLGVFHPDFKTVEPNELIPPYLGVDGARLSFSDANHKAPLCEGKFYKGGQVTVIDWHGTPVASCTVDDGGYPLLVARNPEGRIVAAEVLFDFYEEDDE